MINNRPRRIHLTKGAESRYEEGRAGATLTPGQAVKLSADTYVPTVNIDDTASIFVIEDALQGKTIDDNYASGDLVRMVIPVRGDHILALIPPSTSIPAGTSLKAGAGGNMYAAFEMPGDAVALETRTTGATPTLEQRRIRVRII